MPPDFGNPEAVIDALNAVGIDFSVARNALLNFLGNPEFTPYPAIAQALLQLLDAKALQRPVFIDVIVGFYEGSPGNPSPRRVEDVDVELLERTILAAFNERYGEQITDFDSLLNPAVVTPAIDPEAVLAALDAVGIDFSVARNALLNFLGNAEFTPYPAIAQALLQLLGARALQRPVFIDVIVFNYEHSPGEPSPRRVEDVDVELLKRAILDGFNERYGQQITDFDSLLKPTAVEPLDGAGMAALRLAVGAARRNREVALRALHSAESHADWWRKPDGTFREPQFDDDRPEFESLQPTLDATNAQLVAATAAYDQAMAAYTSAAKVVPLSSTETTAPLLLLPVRLEAVYAETDGGPQLLIRVYPDDVHVDSHEPGLTRRERDAGVGYWEAVFATDATAETREAAWQTLIGVASGYRAMWVRAALTPRNQPPGRPDFPDVTIQPDAWTRSAHTTLLPDRFEFSAYQNGKLVWRKTGAPIPDTLPVGMAPPAGAADDDPDALPFDEASRWLLDFDDAVACGMALSVPLEAADETFDLLTAVGVGSQSPALGGERLQRTLAAHSFTGGLRTLPIGTPTNNTPASRSAWQSRGSAPDPDIVASRLAAYDAAGPQDAARLARAFGVDGAAVLAAVCDPDGADEVLLEKLHRLQADFYAWSDMWFTPVVNNPHPRPPLNTPWYHTLTEHFSAFVRSRGTLPPLRVGRQPYGVLPVSSMDLWRGADPVQIAWYTQSFQAVFAEHADRAARVGEGADQDAVLLDLLSREASPRRYIVRTQFGNGSERDERPIPAEVGAISSTSMLAWIHEFISPGFVPEIIEPFPLEVPEQVSAVLATRPVTTLLGIFDEMLAEDPATLNNDAFFDRWNPVRNSLWQMRTNPTVSQFYCQAEWLQNGLFNSITFAADYIQGKREPGFPEQAAETLAVAAVMRDQLAVYAALEEEAVADLARLEGLLRETFDTLSHRVDAWVTALATARLTDVRADHPQGIRTGAYGWLTEVEPTTPNPSRDGYVLTPSMHHATTAAVLRSGFAAHSDRRAFAVDIQSTRVRRALAVAEGVRAGQTVGALLGYQFERALHDAGLDRCIAGFRAAYPLAPLIEPEGADTARVAIGARNVVDGQALRRDRGRLNDDAALTAAAGTSLNGDATAMRRMLGELDETFDALGDVLLAESVHHLVGGNPLRAGLAADAVGRGEELPAEYEVLRTPRSGVALTHHVGVLFPAAMPGGWNDDRPLARLEPGLEAWLRRRLGPAPAPLAALCAIDLLVAPTETITARGDFDDLLLVCERMRSALSTAAPLAPSHLDAGGWNLDDLGARVRTWLAAVRAAGLDLARLGELGLPVGPSATTADRDRIQTLLDSVDLADPPAPPDDPAGQAAWVSRLIDITGTLLHPAVKIAPILTGPLPPPPSGGADEDAVSAWLRDMTLVRAKVGALDDALVAAEVLAGTAQAPVVVLQPPDPVSNSPQPWLALTAPPDETRPRTSIVLCREDPGPVRGLVMDSWVEVIPAPPGPHGPEEVVAAAFEFDRPGARAPQGLLVAVPPDLERGWCMEDVHGCVEETLQLARVRTLDRTDLPEVLETLPVLNGM